MQKSITSFFSKPSASAISKHPKRSSALSPTAKAHLKAAASSPHSETPPSSQDGAPAPSSPPPAPVPRSPEQRAKIEANRAAARRRLIARIPDATSLDGMTAALEPTWRDALASTLREPFWRELVTFVAAERRARTVFPPPAMTFAAFNHSTFARTRVVIVGQDPYHGPGQAHGMSFSVTDGTHFPPSLHNIFREVANDVEGFSAPKSGCLEKWANQGVLLLNAVLTVRRGEPTSHQSRGWERFTDAVVYALNHRKGPGCVFMLWGGYAKRKGAGIDTKRHCVLTAMHPSPLAANRGGWFGCKHFSKANAFLKKTGQDAIDWKL